MKVLMQSRLNVFSVPGGDTIQMLKTKEYLSKIGVDADICTQTVCDLAEYDVVHLFNLMRPQDIVLQSRNAIRYKKPVVLSTIYGLYTEFDRRARGGLAGFAANILSPYAIEYLKVVARAVRNHEYSDATKSILRRGVYRAQMEICSATRVFLPNSDSEMKRVEKDYHLCDYSYMAVPNAVDLHSFNDGIAVSPEAEAYRGCLLSVARIEGRKCQLQIIRALKGTGIKVVFIGKPGPNSEQYFKRCKEEGDGFTTFLGQVDHEKLPSYYKVASAHALVSWMETPGLSSLEAAAMGCPIVVTEKGDTRDYFGDHAFYSDPENLESIRNAVLAASSAPRNKELQTIVTSRYIWEKAAEVTKKAYEQALKQ